MTKQEAWMFNKEFREFVSSYMETMAQKYGITNSVDIDIHFHEGKIGNIFYYFRSDDDGKVMTTNYCDWRKGSGLGSPLYSEYITGDPIG